MDFDDDLESSAWRRTNQSSSFPDEVDLLEEVDEPVVLLEESGDIHPSATRIIRQARESRFANRAGIVRDPDLSHGNHAASSFGRKLMSSSLSEDESAMDLEIDDDWDHDVSKRIGRIIGSTAVDMAQMNFANGPPSYRPAAAIPPLAEAKAAFMRRVENKRTELYVQDAARKRAEEERSQLEAEKAILVNELSEARKRLEQLELGKM